MIYKSEIILDAGGGYQLEYIEASSTEEARALHLEYLDDDVHDWASEIKSESQVFVDRLPKGWCADKPNFYKVYR